MINYSLYLQGMVGSCGERPCSNKHKCLPGKESPRCEYLEKGIFFKETLFVCLCFMPISTFLGHISEVGPPVRLSWITNQWLPISQQVTGFLSHGISESVVRDKWSLDSASVIICHGEIMPRPRIEPATPGLQIRWLTWQT